MQILLFLWVLLFQLLFRGFLTLHLFTVYLLFIKYVCKKFRKANISYPRAYQGIRNVCFPENFAYVLNELTQTVAFYGEGQKERRIQNPVKHLRWSLLQIYVTAFGH